MVVEGPVARSDAVSAQNHWRVVITALLFAITVQAAGFLWFGINPRGWLCSQLAQVTANLIAVGCTFRAFQRSSGFARYFWFLFTISMILWAAANGFFIVKTLLPGTAYDTQSGELGTLLDFLYRGYGIPVVLILLASEHEEYKDSLTLLDSLQASIVVVALYMALFSLSLHSPLHATLVANTAVLANVENTFLMVAAALRWRFSRSLVERGLFLRLCMFLLVYLVICGVGNYVTQHGPDTLAAWMDLFWTIPYSAAAVMAVRWTMPATVEMPRKPLPTRSLGRVMAKNLAWSLAVICVCLLIVAFGEWQLIAGKIAAGIALALYALRLSLTQHRQAQTIENLSRVKQELFETHLRDTLILDSAGEGILGLDAEGRHTFVNAAAGRMFGCSPAKLIGQPVHTTWRHTGADGRPFPRDKCPICCMDREVRRGQSELFWRKDGSSFFVDYVRSPIRDGEQIAGAVVVFQDLTDRIGALEALRLQGRALDTSANTIVITDVFGNILWANPAFETLTGYSLSEVAGQNPRILKSGKQGQDFYRKLWATICSGKVWHGELENRRKDGSLYVEEMTITPLRSSAGTITNFIAVKQDITRRKRAEEELRQSEERFRLAFEQGPLGIILVGKDFRLLKVNRAFCGMLGYTEEEILARTLTDITHPEDRESNRRHGEIILKGEASSHQWQKRYVKKNGEIVTAEVSANLVRDEEGNPLYSLGIIADITNEKRAEEALRASEQRYRLAVTAANDAVWDTDLDHGTVHCNETFYEIFGSPNVDADPWQWWIGRIHPEDQQRVMVTFRAALQGRETSWACEYRCRRKDGQWADIFDRAYIGRGDSDRALRVTRSMSDVTEKRLLEAQLRRAQKLDAIGRLAGGVAHDFNNVLGIILGYCDLIETQLPPEHPGTNGLSEIKKAGCKAANLTRKLLAFSRHQTTLPQVLDLNSLIEEFGKMLTRLIGEDIEYNFVAGEKLGRVKADPSLIEQVLINLAVNARDAMPSGGKFSIKTANVEVDERYAAEYSAMKHGAYAWLSVADTGCGIDSQTLPHIFDPFFTTKEPEKGTGLGLSIVYGAVKQSGGHIWVKSEPNHGTTFEIFLPVTTEGLSAAEVTAPVPSLQGSETILVAEDELALQELIRIVLTKAGYTVLAARNGVEALALLSSVNGGADLFIADIVMPGELAGQPLADAVRAIQPRIRSLFMTGYAGDRRTESALASEDVLITKPFDSSMLLRTVREMLDRGTRARGATGE